MSDVILTSDESNIKNILVLNTLQAHATSSIVLFSKVLEPLLMISNRQSLSVNNWTGTLLPRSTQSSFDKAIEKTKKISKGDHLIWKIGICDLKSHIWFENYCSWGICFSTIRTMYPNCEDKSRLMANEESQNPTTRAEFTLTFGRWMHVRLLKAYLTASFSLSTNIAHLCNLKKTIESWVRKPPQ